MLAALTAAGRLIGCTSTRGAFSSHPQLASHRRRGGGLAPERNGSGLEAMLGDESPEADMTLVMLTGKDVAHAVDILPS